MQKSFPPWSVSDVFSFLAEIPLFHVLNARITFGNVNKCSTEEEAKPTPAATPTSSGEDEEAAGRNVTSSATTVYFVIVITDPLFLFLFLPPALPLFSVCPSVFEVPASYHRRGGSRHAPASNNDEELLQYAIHQSLLESRRAAGQVRTIKGKSVIFWTSTLYLNILMCKWLIGQWILLLVMTSVLICPLINSAHPNLILSFSSCSPIFCKSLHPISVPYCTLVSLQEGSWDDADGEFPDVMPSSQSNR